MARPGFRCPVVLTLAAGVSLAILISLGVWQFQRLGWKTQLLADIAAAKAAPVTSLDNALAAAKPEFRRVQIVCPALSAAPYVELQAIVDGKPGVRLISACPHGRGSILVDRGFVAETISARPPQTGTGEAVEITGILRQPDPPTSFSPPPDGRRFYWRDLPAMAKALGAPRPAAWFIAAETSSNPEWQALVPSALPAEIPNRHLEYALTWFGLAGALLAVYAAMLVRRIKAP